MSYDGSLKFDTKIDSNGFSTGLSKLKKLAKTGVGTVGTVTSKATDMIGKFTSVVTTSVATVSAGIGTIGTAATRVGMDFEAAMSKVSSISGATGNDLQSLTDKAKEMGATTKFSATESAEAFQYMAMAGWDTKSMLDGIDGIMNLSAADGLDLATTSDIVTDALTAFGLSAKDSTHFADVLATASSSANTNVSMLGESFKYVAPLAGSMNYSVEDVSLALGLMANARLQFIMSYGSNSVSYSMDKVNSGDVVVFDGINCKVTKNGLNAFGDSNVVEFPKLHPGKNIYIAQHSSPVKVEFVTEYYPTFI